VVNRKWWSQLVTQWYVHTYKEREMQWDVDGFGFIGAIVAVLFQRYHIICEPASERVMVSVFVPVYYLLWLSVRLSVRPHESRMVDNVSVCVVCIQTQPHRVAVLAEEHRRISPANFMAECHKKRLNQGSVCRSWPGRQTLLHLHWTRSVNLWHCLSIINKMCL